MKPKNYFELMAAYNRSMNLKIYEVCGQLTDEERKLDRGVFFGSLHSTLNHLLFGDRSWMQRFTGREYDLKPLGEDLYSNFNELRDERESMDEEIVDWCQTLSLEWLSKIGVYKSQTYRTVRRFPNWLLVTHMFNHQTHHRGQVTAMLSQCECDYGITDIPFMEGLEDFE